MKKTGITAIVAGALIVAGGGTAMAVNAASTPAPVVSTQTAAAEATSTPAASSTPAVDQPTATPLPVETGDAAFLVGMRFEKPSKWDAYTDSELLALGNKICQMFRDGTAYESVTVTTMTDPVHPSGQYNTQIVGLSASRLCPGATTPPPVVPVYIPPVG